MKKKKSISLPKRGINKDSSISDLKNTEYSIAVNVNSNNEGGDSTIIQIEPSNYYGVIFPDTYKVIGFKNDNLKDRTYYYLTSVTNDETSLNYKRSSIGYVDNTVNETFNQDVLTDICHSCNKKNTLSPALEDIIQTPTQVYVELVHDRCIPIDEIEDKGLNFNINSPILKIEIKQEKLNTKLYWDDYRNYFRFLDVTNIEEAREKETFDYLHSLDIVCDDLIETPCLQVDKLLVEPKHTRIVLEAQELQVGGSLKMGNYEFYAAYCDIYGNEMSQYCTPTNPISIFDENNNILAKNETDSYTNFAIKIKAKNLDVKNFKYYKVVAVEVNTVQNKESAFLAGIYPTVDDTIVYSQSETTNTRKDSNQTGNIGVRPRVDFNTLLAVKQRYKRAKGTMSSDNRLFRYGLEVEEELNIQPVLNLLSSLHWQTSVASEDLYKSSIATSNYKAYMRNEVQTFALRLLYKDGGYSVNFPLIGRPKNETDAEIITDKNFNSLVANAPECSNNARTEKWQIFNTAEEYEEQCYSFDDGGYLTQTEDVVKTCEILAVAEIPTNSALIEIDQDYTDLPSYIEDNYAEIINPASDLYIPSIAPYLIDTYPTQHCTPNFANSCELPPTLDSFINIIGNVDYNIPIGEPLIIGKRYLVKNLIPGDDFSNVGYIKEEEYFTAVATTPLVWLNTEVLIEDKSLIESDFPLDYDDTIVKSVCRIYKAGDNNGVKEDIRARKETVLFYPDGNYADDESYISLMPCGKYLIERELYSSNLTNLQPDVIQNLTLINTNTYIQSYFNDYDISATLTDLVETRLADALATGFSTTLHKKALWFQCNNVKDRFIFEVTPQKLVEGGVDGVADGTIVRLSFYKSNKGALPPFFSTLVDLSTGSKFLFEKTSTTSFNVTNELGATTSLAISSGKFYVAVDCKIVTEFQSQVFTRATAGEGASVTECLNLPSVAYRIAPTNGCYGIVTREIEYSKAIINWFKIQIDKKETYSSTCTFRIPKINACEPKPYKKGKFAYWESTEPYPDNKQLYDSSTIKIKPSDLSNLSTRDKEEFLLNYTTSTLTPFLENLDTEGNYIYKPNETDFRCKPIRHFKMPDNTVAPFIIDTPNYQKNADSIIFPLGVSLDGNVVKTVLDLAVKNNLITQKQRDNIQGYEILKGDNTIHKTIIANGIGSDMYNYQSNNDKVHFTNFPFNDLGNNKFVLDSNTNNLISHPNAGLRNHLFSFMSPDIYLTKPAIPTEVTLQGFQQGNAQTGFASVDKHPQWTVLGDNAKRTAERLAIAEVTLEFIIKISELITTGGVGHTWVLAGFAGGTNAIGAAFSGVATAAAAAAQGVASFMKIGKYRYEWLKTFRDLGRTDNFAEFQYAHGRFNRFLKVPRYSEDYVRALTIGKYLKDGDYQFVDKNDGSSVKVNNWLREYSVLFSTGSDFEFDYPESYVSFDNNTRNSNSSNFIKSDVRCDSTGTYTRDIASPYFSLKNYVPDQWGGIDTIKWLTTNYIFDLNQDTSCETIFGGTVCISRFSYRKKVPLFRKNDIGSADKLPFKYSRYSNISKTRFFCDYETEDDGIYTGTGLPFPDIATSLSGFDCISGRRDFYVKPPSKFYLFVHGVSDFLVESEINCNFRYAGKEPQDQFFQSQNLSEWLQESNLSIVEPNTFYYNNTYSQNVSNTPFKVFNRTYDKDTEKKRNIQDNAWIWTEKDVNEADLTDPWRVFKPLNKEEGVTDNGKLIDLKDLESGQFYARYEDALHLYTQLQEQKITPQNRELGTGMLYNPPIEFKKADLGFAGTQNTDICSTPYGNFSVDAKRGRMIKTNPNGQEPEIISESIQGQPSGMKQWFREHLPYKILKQYPNLNINNKFKGIGMNIWYDDRNSRIFFTKRDYISKNNPCLKYDDKVGFYNDCGEPTCPDGFQYNTQTNNCVKNTDVPICPVGFTYNNLTNECVKTEITLADCATLPSFQSSFKWYTTEAGGINFFDFRSLTPQNLKCYIENTYLNATNLTLGGALGIYHYNSNIVVGDVLYGNISPLTQTNFNGTYLLDVSFEVWKIVTIANSTVTAITDFSTLNNC